MLDTVKLTRELMEFRPVSSDLDAVNNTASHLVAYLRENGIYTKTEKLGKRKIIFASTSRGKSQNILFNSHLDVVPAETECFVPREKSGWLWGRGSGDCLGNTAVVANTLVACRDCPGIGAVFSTDEEVGGQTTAKMVKLGYRGKNIIVVDTEGYTVAVAQKGLLTVKLSAKGKACHGSTPWMGRNALDRLIDGYARIRNMHNRAKPGDEWHTTMSANMLTAGTVFNRVPDLAELILDIRHTEKMTPSRIVSELRKRSGLKAEILHVHPVVFCDEKSELTKNLVSHMKTCLKRKIRTIRMNGATDARHFATLKSSIVMIGAPAREWHASGERVSIKGLREYEKMLVSFCQNQCLRLK